MSRQNDGRNVYLYVRECVYIGAYNVPFSFPRVNLGRVSPDHSVRKTRGPNNKKKPVYFLANNVKITRIRQKINR